MWSHLPHGKMNLKATWRPPQVELTKMRKCNKKIHHNLLLHHLKTTPTTMKKKKKKKKKMKMMRKLSHNINKSYPEFEQESRRIIPWHNTVIEHNTEDNLMYERTIRRTIR